MPSSNIKLDEKSSRGKRFTVIIYKQMYLKREKGDWKEAQTDQDVAPLCIRNGIEKAKKKT